MIAPLLLRHRINDGGDPSHLFFRKRSTHRVFEALAAWEKKHRKDVDWTPIVATKLEATNGAKLVPQPDLSVIASDKNGKGNYVVTAQTHLENGNLVGALSIKLRGSLINLCLASLSLALLGVIALYVFVENFQPR